jgi:hypothetical protein
MPLTQKVSFITMLKKENRIPVPGLVRWQYKLEPDQVLHVGINGLEEAGNISMQKWAKMDAYLF